MVISLMNLIIYKGKLNSINKKLNYITKKQWWRNIINFPISESFHVNGTFLRSDIAEWHVLATTDTLSQ